MTSKILGVFLLLTGCCAEHSISIDEFVRLIPEWEVPPGSPHTVVGDDGLAYGHYQMHNIMVEDYNRISGSKAVHEDAFDADFSAHMSCVILTHYAGHIKASGVTPTTDHMLFIWNGGGGAWSRVDNPINDNKQKNLERYKRRANLIINQYLNEKKGR